MYKLIFITAFFLTAMNVAAQDTLNSKTVEQKSYYLFLEKNWKELIRFGKEAIDKGFDYYYLRMRIGIAYYEQQNYREAQRNFWKAYAFNSSEEVLKEYLYYCYIYLGQYAEARKFTKSFSKTLSEKLGTDNPNIAEFVFVDGGLKKSSNTQINSHAYFEDFGIGHRIGKNVSFLHEISLFNQQRQQGKFVQNQYYLRSNIPIGRNWLLSPAGTIISKSFTANPPPTPPSGHYLLPLPQKHISYFFLSSIMIKKSFSYYDISIGSSVSNIDSVTQLQHSASLSYFPFGNNKVFFTGIGYIQTENSYQDVWFSFSQSIFASPFSKFWLSLSYLGNKAKNINEDNGFIINNSADLTTSRWSALANFSLNKKVDLYTLYLLENKLFQKDNVRNYYYYKTLIFGLKLKL